MKIQTWICMAALLLSSLACKAIMGDGETAPDPVATRRPTSQPKNLPTLEDDIPTPEDFPTLDLPIDTLGGDLKINISTSETFYDIEGETEDELRDQMNSLGYLTDDGERFDANTDWRYTWNVNFTETSDECKVNPDTIELSLTLTYYLPRWSNSQGAPQSLINKWNKYMTALLEHEHHHGKIATDGTQTIYNAILNTPAESSCSTLEETVNAAAHDAVEEIRAEQNAFDDETNHGMNEGAVFP